MKDNDIKKRLFDFGIKVLKLLSTLPKSLGFNIIRYQLAMSLTSSGANYKESQAGSSKADFNNKVRISLREMRESNYWLRIIKATIPEDKNAELLKILLDESQQLKNFWVQQLLN